MHQREDAASAVPRILVIDDDRMILDLVESILEPEGLAIRTAEDGANAIDLFQREAAISLIILDWHMPGMPGEQVLDQLLAIRSGARVIVSSAASPSQVERAFAGRGVLQFLPKPFQVQNLLAAVRLALAA